MCCDPGFSVLCFEDGMAAHVLVHVSPHHVYKETKRAEG